MSCKRTNRNKGISNREHAMKTQLISSLLSVTLLVTACGKKQQTSDQQKPPESVAQPQTPPPQPQVAKETELKPEQAKPKPLPPPPTVIPAGTPVTIRTTTEIDSSKMQPGQSFEASLAEPLIVKGKMIAPQGAPVAGRIAQSSSAGRVKGEGTLSLALAALSVHGHLYPIATSAHVETSKSRGKRSAGMIGGGTGAGALIGGLAGGGKGAAIGALAGAGAGTAGATLTGKRNIVIPSESVLSFTLSKALTLGSVTPNANSEQVDSEQATPPSDQPR